jgi:serine/threonine protein kinase
MNPKGFQREVESMIKAKHKNVVRFLGYCGDTQQRADNYNGNFVMADVEQRLLCFEYLPRGTLRDHITGRIMRHKVSFLLYSWMHLKIILFKQPHI